MAFDPKSRQQLVAAMASAISANSPISDFTPGSTVRTLIEAAAQEDFAQYVQMLEIIRGYNLDTTEGEDLDNRASEYRLTRLASSPHTGFVTISDSRFEKVSSKIYAGLPGPTAGSTQLFVDDASGFAASGNVYVGRGTSNEEGPIAYSAAPVDNTSYWIITLDTALNNDHGTDETVILAQQGNRVIKSGTEVKIPATSFSDEVTFELNQDATLLDGENSVENILVTALEPGGFQVPSNSIVQFGNSPFTGARVTNPLPFVNGRDEETDQELRDRIRSTTQSLSRGTTTSIGTGIIGLIDGDTNSSIVSANIQPPVVIADGPTRVYIDNGRGLQPELASVGLETLLTRATGGEQFLQAENFPFIKANVVSQNAGPFSLSGLETLIYRVGTDEETFIFLASDFKSPGKATALEIAVAINNRATLIEARTITESSSEYILLFPKARVNEELQIDSASTSQTALNFSTDLIFTSKLYKNDKLLTKDGLTASILSDAQPFDLASVLETTTDSDITVTPGSRIVTKTVAGTDPFTQKVREKDYIKFTSDNDNFYIQVREVLSDTKILLETAYPEFGGGTGNINIWHSIQLEVSSNGDIEETEVASFGPNDFGTPLQALASEVITRLQLEINLSKTQLAVNDTKVQVISEKENSEESKIQITGGGAGISLGLCTSAPLTGSITVVGNDRVVNGTGTLFTSELSEGQWIRVASHDNGSWSKVKTIESDTVLYLESGYRGPNATAAAGQFMNPSTLVQGKNKEYTLNTSNGLIELAEPAVAGDKFTLGSINTRAFLNSLPEAFDFDSVGATSNLIVCVDGGFKANVTTGDASAPYSTFTSNDLIGFGTNFFNGFYLKWTSGNNIGEIDYVATYNTATGEITTITGFSNPVLTSDKFVLCQVLDFTHATDFSDPENATAQEVVDAINSQILGALAEVVNEPAQVRIRTSNFTDEGSIEILGGSANNVLLMSENTLEVNQETNVAFVSSSNSDRDGLTEARGFTIGPDQNLVIILDNDFANKTFSVPLKIDATATSGGTGVFSASGLTTNYTADDFFNNFWIYGISGANEGRLGVVTDFVAVTGTFSVSGVYPSSGFDPITSGDEFALVPRTAENFVKLTQDLNTTTLSILADIEATKITGDFIQISTKVPGSEGKVFVTGGSGNSIGISIIGLVAGGAVNDLEVNSKAGLSKGLPVNLTVDGTVTTGDATPSYDTFLSDQMISTVAGAFNGLVIEFLTGANSGHITTVASYNNTTGEIVLTDETTNAINVSDSFRIYQPAFISDIQGTTAPFQISFQDIDGTDIDVTVFTAERSSAIRDNNGFNFSTIQVEGVDGHKYFTGLVQQAQFTIDGLDRDQDTYPGIGAAGTQFEVLPPVLTQPDIAINVTTEEGISLSSVSNDISSAVLEYVNSRKVGEDVILSEIIASVQGVDGVFDVEITNFTDNITIADNELVRINEENVVIG